LQVKVRLKSRAVVTPFAGITRIRFLGYDLSPLQAPLFRWGKGSTEWGTREERGERREEGGGRREERS
jgi:hypothetical protein